MFIWQCIHISIHYVVHLKLIVLSVNHLNKTENTIGTNKKTPKGPGSKYHLEESGCPQGRSPGQKPGLEGRVGGPAGRPRPGPSLGLFPRRGPWESSTSSVTRGCSEDTKWPTVWQCHPATGSLGQRWGSSGLLSPAD